MSVLKKYFRKDTSWCSPVRDDLVRIVNYDKDGNEKITYEKFDYEAHQKKQGTVDMWSLDSLLKAGINPDFPIHTGLNTRLEGLSTIADAEAIADSLISAVEDLPEVTPIEE